MGDGSNGVDQVQVCTEVCGGRCCRYLTISVDAPMGHVDWDEMRWWLCHEGVMVTKDEDGWMLHVQTPCRNLLPNNLCGIYEDRPTTCAAYEADNCEHTGDVPYDIEFREPKDLADYLEKRKLKRGRDVAKAIRETDARPAARPSLVQIQPLR